MPSLKDIRRRISSVKNTQKITRAMKLVSTAKLRRAKIAMSELKPYASKYREMVSTLVGQLGGDGGHPLMRARPEVKRVGVFVLSSDRGMCGGFNGQIQKQLTRYAAERDAQIVVYPIGRRVAKFAKKSDLTVGEVFGEIIAAAASTEGIRHVTDTLVGAFTSGEVDEVVLIYNEFVSAMTQTPIVRQLLPLAAETEEAPESSGDPIYEPDQQTLLAYAVPRFVEVQVRQAILESIAGEHAARMNAMSSATDNASDMIRALTLQANRARQAAITKELMEIISGAEAL